MPDAFLEGDVPSRLFTRSPPVRRQLFQSSPPPPRHPSTEPIPNRQQWYSGPCHTIREQQPPEPTIEGLLTVIEARLAALEAQNEEALAQSKRHQRHAAVVEAKLKALDRRIAALPASVHMSALFPPKPDPVRGEKSAIPSGAKKNKRVCTEDTTAKRRRLKEEEEPDV